MEPLFYGRPATSTEELQTVTGQHTYLHSKIPVLCSWFPFACCVSTRATYHRGITSSPPKKKLTNGTDPLRRHYYPTSFVFTPFFGEDLGHGVARRVELSSFLEVRVSGGVEISSTIIVRVKSLGKYYMRHRYRTETRLISPAPLLFKQLVPSAPLS